MSEAWAVVLFAGLASMALKSAGPVAIGGRPLPQRVMGVVGSLAPALLAALVATQTVATGRDLVVDERMLGVAVAAVLIWRKAPVLVVVVAAALVTALARAL